MKAIILILLGFASLYSTYTGGKRIVKMPGTTFIGRFLQHVLPPGFKRIHHYGLLAPARKSERLRLARLALDMPAPNRLAEESAAQFRQRVAQQDILHCPNCRQGTLRLVAGLLPNRSAIPGHASTLCRRLPVPGRHENHTLCTQYSTGRNGFRRLFACCSPCVASIARNRPIEEPVFAVLSSRPAIPSRMAIAVAIHSAYRFDKSHPANPIIPITTVIVAVQSNKVYLPRCRHAHRFKASAR